MNAALLSSQNMNWCTPQDFFDELNAEFHFALDVAATERSAKCANFFTPETDGLAQSWNCGGAVFCNPPYGRELKKWIRKAYTEAQSGKTIVLLIPARTDTAAFHDYIYGKAGRPLLLRFAFKPNICCGFTNPEISSCRKKIVAGNIQPLSGRVRPSTAANHRRHIECWRICFGTETK